MLDVSAPQEPTLGGRFRTFRGRFAGSEAGFRAANPLDVLASSASRTAQPWWPSGSRTPRTALRLMRSLTG